MMDYWYKFTWGEKTYFNFRAAPFDGWDPGIDCHNFHNLTTVTNYKLIHHLLICFGQIFYHNNEKVTNRDYLEWDCSCHNTTTWFSGHSFRNWTSDYSYYKVAHHLDVSLPFYETFHETELESNGLIFSGGGNFKIAKWLC